MTKLILVLGTSLIAKIAWAVNTEPWGIVQPCDGECDLQDFFDLLGSVLNYFVEIAVPLAGAAIVVAGVMFVTARGDSGKLSTAKSILWTAVWGLVIILAAYLIVKTILGELLDPTVIKNPLS